MLYDCRNPLDKENFLARAQFLANREDVVELRTKRQRSLNQNGYLHVILDWFGCQYGEDAEFVKTEYFKKLVNPDYFILGKKRSKFSGQEYYQLRSTADLTTEEMSVCIERFRNWASKEAGIYIPTAEEGIIIRQCEIEIAKARRYL